MWSRWGIIAVVVGALGAIATPAVASCEDAATVMDDPRVQYETADVVGVGRLHTDANGDRIVDFDQVVKGDAPAEMDIGPKPDMCELDVPRGTVGLFLTRSADTWDVSSTPSDVAVAAADPLPHDGSGPAVLLERTGSSRDPLVTLDAQAKALESSPPGEPYAVLSVCPGAQTAVAWRPDGTSDRLGLSGLAVLGAGPNASAVGSLRAPTRFSLRCTTGDGDAALGVWTAGSSDRIARFTPEGARPLRKQRISEALPQIIDASHVLVEGRGQVRVLDVVSGKVRWRLRRKTNPLNPPRIAPDARHALLAVGEFDDYPAIVDLRGAHPHLRLLEHRSEPGARWLGSNRIVIGKPAITGTADSPIVDLRGRVVGQYRGAGFPQPVVSGDRAYGLRPPDGLEAAPRAGGSAQSLALPLWTEDLQSLTG